MLVGRNASVFEVAATTPGTGISRRERAKSSKHLDDFLPAVKRMTELGTVNSALLAPASSSSGGEGAALARARGAMFATCLNKKETPSGHSLCV